MLLLVVVFFCRAPEARNRRVGRATGGPGRTRGQAG